MDELFSKKPAGATTVKVQSDGPSNQFKNKYIMGLLDKLSRKHNVRMIWNFSATSHGKGPVDGLGATVKREAGQKICTRQHNINNLDDFEKAVVNLKSIKITKISSEKVFEHAAQLELREFFENTLPVPMITQCHFMCRVNGVTETKLYTSQSEDDTNRDTTEQDEIMEEVMEPDLSTLPPTVGQIVAVHLHEKRMQYC